MAHLTSHRTASTPISVLMCSGHLSSPTILCILVRIEPIIFILHGHGTPRLGQCPRNSASSRLHLLALRRLRRRLPCPFHKLSNVGIRRQLAALLQHLRDRLRQSRRSTACRPACRPSTFAHLLRLPELHLAFAVIDHPLHIAVRHVLSTPYPLYRPWSSTIFGSLLFCAIVSSLACHHSWSRGRIRTGDLQLMRLMS